MNQIVLIDESLCIGCGICVKICPKKILYIDKTDNVCRVTDETRCDKRRGCERKCPTGAIKIKKENGRNRGKGFSDCSVSESIP